MAAPGVVKRPTTGLAQELLVSLNERLAANPSDEAALLQRAAIYMRKGEDSTVGACICVLVSAAGISMPVV
jgi:hypothetical protein